MPVSHLIIDGNKVPVEDVLSGKVNTRFPKAYLELAADFRKWDGKPHVTDLLNGFRLMWLKHNTMYSVDPDDAAYRVLGVQAHAKLEEFQGQGETAELGLETDEIQGRTDLICTINGIESITDYKVVGSYKIQQALGLYYDVEPVMNPDGTPYCFKSGARKGQPKTRRVLKKDPAKADIKDFARQLNIYRYLFWKMYGKVIDSLNIFAIVRDGGTKIALERGILQKTYTFPVPVVPFEKVEAFVTKRSQELREVMAATTAPALCSPDECWQGKRCKDFCEVSEACKALGDNPFLGAAEEEEEDE